VHIVNFGFLFIVHMRFEEVGRVWEGDVNRCA
jgi:hypothetical protein